jgi:hypothetical protein
VETGNWCVPVDSRWTSILALFYAAARMDDALLRLGCRGCRELFFVGRGCFRGHACCGEVCRPATRVLSARAARGRHEQSDAGRLDHRDRQRAYRMRRRAALPARSAVASARVQAPSARVTHQGSTVAPQPAIVSPPRSESPRRAPIAAARPTCARCVQESAWVRFLPPSGIRMGAREAARRPRRRARPSSADRRSTNRDVVVWATSRRRCEPPSRRAWPSPSPP